MGRGKNGPGGGRTQAEIDQSSRATNPRDPEGKASLDNRSVQLNTTAKTDEKRAGGS